MKQTTKMSRAVSQLEHMYNALNADKFDGALPVPIITVQSKPGTWGHCTTAKVWRRKDTEAYELNVAAEVLTAPIEEVIDTLLHEMVHLYCRENGIQEVSRGGKYHNGRFKALAEQVGLVCVREGQYGWNTVGAGNDKLIEYAIKKGWSELCIERHTFSRVGIAGVGGNRGDHVAPTGARAPSSTRKLQCPCCGNSVRATKAVRIMCMDCMEQMQEA